MFNLIDLTFPDRLALFFNLNSNLFRIRLRDEATSDIVLYT